MMALMTEFRDMDADDMTFGERVSLREMALEQAVKWCTWSGATAATCTDTAQIFAHYLLTGESMPPMSPEIEHG